MDNIFAEYKTILQQYLFDIALFDHLQAGSPEGCKSLTGLSREIEDNEKRLCEIKETLGYEETMPFLTGEQPFDGFNIVNRKVTGDRDKAVEWASEKFWKFCDEPEDFNVLFETAVFVLAYFELN